MMAKTENPLRNLNPDTPVDFKTIITRLREGYNDFSEALQYYADLAKERIENIKTHGKDFQEVVVALEEALQEIQECASIFATLHNAECIEQVEALAQEVSSFMAKFFNDLYLDEKLFEKIHRIFQTKEGVETEEDHRLLEYYWNQFRRNGSLLDEKKKQRLRQIDEELAILYPKFSENVLKATNMFYLHVENPEDVEGLPEFLKETGKENAKRRNLDGYVFTLQFPEYLPFITYAGNEELRKTMYVAYRSRAFGGTYDNQEVIKRILRLREERAKLLGYENHAHYVLEERMAKSPDTVMKFLDELYKHVFPKAQEEFRELLGWVKSEFHKDTIRPWDYRYYAEKWKRERYHVDQEMLRPYFPLESVLDGLFLIAGKLFGLRFRENLSIPVYHEEVKVYEVYQEEEFLGYLYLDLFPRATKKSGAWMTTIREQGLFMGKIVRPHVAIVCNFTRPTETKPSLLTLEEVKTLFHEFGHALHGIFSKVTYRSLAGTNVFWDFVELPSQLMENWAKEKESLSLFARHYETSEPVPDEIMEKIKNAELFHAGIQFLTQLQYGYLDMMYHTTPFEEIGDIPEFEKKVTKKTRLWEEPEGVCFSTSFSHIFAGGYAAGYYSYKWAEVLEADAFSLFQEKGIFDRETAIRYQKAILEKGNTSEPMELYKNFRGKEPSIEALLKKFRLLDEERIRSF